MPTDPKITGTITTKASKDFRVVPYQAALENDWNQVLELALNATLMHRRSFLAYHGDRFEDCSTMIYRGNEPLAVFPAHREGEEVHSHKGLSYAGMIHKPCSFNQELELFKFVLKHFEDLGITRITMKETPGIYNSIAQDSNLYIMGLAGAQIKKSELSLAMPLPLNIKHEGRKNKIRQAIRMGFQVVESNEVKQFWESLLVPNLKNRFGVSPTHKADEMQWLKERHPENIRLYMLKKEEWLAGALLFVTPTVIHCQYLATNERGRQLHALDFLIHHLCKNTFSKYRFFDFGHSHEQDGKKINRGLFQWKESFGAQGYLQRHFTLHTSNWRKLESLYC